VGSLRSGVPGKPDSGLLGWSARVPGTRGFRVLRWSGSRPVHGVVEARSRTNGSPNWMPESHVRFDNFQPGQPNLPIIVLTRGGDRNGTSRDRSGIPPQPAKTARTAIPACQHRASREPWVRGPVAAESPGIATKSGSDRQSRSVPISAISGAVLGFGFPDSVAIPLRFNAVPLRSTPRSAPSSTSSTRCSRQHQCRRQTPGS
jgi:hypothetical protein